MNKTEQLSDRGPSRRELEEAAGTCVKILALVADLEETTGERPKLAEEVAGVGRTEDWHGYARALRKLPEREHLPGHRTRRHLNAAAAVLAETSVRRFEIERLLEGPYNGGPLVESLAESVERLEEAIMTTALELGRLLVLDESELFEEMGYEDPYEEPRLSAIE